VNDGLVGRVCGTVAKYDTLTAAWDQLETPDEGPLWALATDSAVWTGTEVLVIGRDGTAQAISP
jgi:hypothetical protein